MSSTDRAIAALRSGHANLSSFVDALGDDELSRTSWSADWDIDAVLNHVGQGAGASLAQLRDAMGERRPQGDGSATDLSAPTPRQRATAGLAATKSLVEAYEALSPADHAEVSIDVGFLPMSVDVATAVRLCLTELTLHAWDIRVVFDPSATLDQQATEVLLHAPPDLTAWLGQSDAIPQPGHRVAVRTTGPDSTFTLCLESPVRLAFDDGADADGRIDLPAEAWLRLTTGRLTPEVTPEQVTTDGATDLASLRSVFVGY